MSERSSTDTEVAAANEDSSPSNIVTRRQVDVSYSSPIPLPKILKGYKEVDPTFPERIMAEFERNSEHAREQEKAALKLEAETTKRGQYMAFFIAVMLLGVVIASIVLDNTTFAGVSGLAFFAFLARSFLPGSDKKNNDSRQ